MNVIINYLDTQNELNTFEERLNLILIYETELKKEKETITKIIQLQKETISIIENNLKSLHGIEYKLYYEIVVNGMNITKAVEKVAFDENMDVSTIWKNYYPKIKEKLNIKIKR